MSDVRDQLQRLVSEWFNEPPGIDEDTELVNRIMERFDVVPKPAVTATQLGRILGWVRGADAEQNGLRLLKDLESCGLRIVRVDDES